MLTYIRVAGVSFYQPSVLKCKVGDKVKLVPEPKNKHDPHAIKVMVRRRKIGYIPRTVNQDVAEMSIVSATVYSMRTPAAVDIMGLMVAIEYAPQEPALRDGVAVVPTVEALTMRFHQTACGDWFRVKDAVFLACDHTKEIALKFDAAGKFIARVRLQPDTEIEFLGRYVTSAFEIAGESRTPPRGAKGRFISKDGKQSH